jgi:hypothetical protein
MLMTIPAAPFNVEAMVYATSFGERAHGLARQLATALVAIRGVLTSRALRVVFAAAIKLANSVNKRQLRAISLKTLDMMRTTKTKDGKPVPILFILVQVSA